MAKAAKAVFAGVSSFVGSLATALTAGQSLGSVDAKTWCVVVGFTLASAGGVYGITNKK